MISFRPSVLSVNVLKLYFSCFLVHFQHNVIIIVFIGEDFISWKNLCLILFVSLIKYKNNYNLYLRYTCHCLSPFSRVKPLAVVNVIVTSHLKKPNVIILSPAMGKYRRSSACSSLVHSFIYSNGQVFHYKAL